MKTTIEGIVLNETNYGETSKILNVLTKEYGYISIISKGSRKIKSKLRGISMTLVLANFTINYKPKGISTLIEGNSINSLKNIFELNQNNRIIDLYNMLYNGIITKNIIYFNAEFINNLDNKYNEYSAINSNNYFKLKNIIKNYHTIDMYSNIVDNNLNTYKLITNISYPLLVLLSIIVILVICYIINNIKEEYYSDFNKLKYYSFTRKDLNKIFSKYMIIIVLSSVLTSLLISYFVIDVLNSYLIMCNNLIADIFIYNYFYLFILVVLIIILIKLVVLLLNKK